MRRRKSLIVLLIAVASLSSFLALNDRTTGAEEARQDIQRGHLEIRGYGLPAHWLPNYARQLDVQLGVQYHTIAGSSVSDGLRKHTNEYNQVMKKEIERRFGPGILEQLADEATQTYATTQPAA